MCWCVASSCESLLPPPPAWQTTVSGMSFGTRQSGRGTRCTVKNAPIKQMKNLEMVSRWEGQTAVQWRNIVAIKLSRKPDSSREAQNRPGTFVRWQKKGKKKSVTATTTAYGGESFQVSGSRFEYIVLILWESSCFKCSFLMEKTKIMAVWMTKSPYHMWSELCVTCL